MKGRSISSDNFRLKSGKTILSSCVLIQVLRQMGSKYETPLQFKFRARFYPQEVTEEIIQDITLVREAIFFFLWFFLSIYLII